MKHTHILILISLFTACSSGRHFDYQKLNLDKSKTGILGDFEANGNQLIIVYKGIIRIKPNEAEVLFNIDTKGAEFLLLAETLKPVYERSRFTQTQELTHFRGKRSMIFVDDDKPYIVFMRDPDVEYSDPGFSVIEMKRIKPEEYTALKAEYEEARKQTKEWFYKNKQ